MHHQKTHKDIVCDDIENAVARFNELMAGVLRNARRKVSASDAQELIDAGLRENILDLYDRTLEGRAHFSEGHNSFDKEYANDLLAGGFEDATGDWGEAIGPNPNDEHRLGARELGVGRFA